MRTGCRSLAARCSLVLALVALPIGVSFTWAADNKATPNNVSKSALARLVKFFIKWICLIN